MVLLVFVTLLVLSLAHWLFIPVLQILTPVLSLAWLGWGALVLVLWLFAGPDGPPSNPQP